jgi:hypothetical protein
VEGIGNLIASQVDRERLRQLLGALEAKRRLIELLNAYVDARQQNVRVVVGLEETIPEMHSMVLIGAPALVGAESLGTVAVLGPVRLQYQETMNASRSSPSSRIESCSRPSNPIDNEVIAGKSMAGSSQDVGTAQSAGLGQCLEEGIYEYKKQLRTKQLQQRRTGTSSEYRSGFGPRGRGDDRSRRQGKLQRRR